MAVVITGKEYYDALTYFISFFARALIQSISPFPIFPSSVQSRFSYHQQQHYGVLSLHHPVSGTGTPSPDAQAQTQAHTITQQQRLQFPGFPR